MMLLKQEVLTHCQWALCCCMQKTHFYCSTGGKSRDKGVLTPSSPCVWPKHVSPCTGVCAAPEKNLCQWWVGAVYCSRWEKEGAMSALWQSQGKAGSWEYGVGGEAGSHLNTESGVLEVFLFSGHCDRCQQFICWALTWRGFFLQPRYFTLNKLD